MKPLNFKLTKPGKPLHLWPCLFIAAVFVQIPYKAPLIEKMGLATSTNSELNTPSYNGNDPPRASDHLPPITFYKSCSFRHKTNFSDQSLYKLTVTLGHYLSTVFLCISLCLEHCWHCQLCVQRVLSQQYYKSSKIIIVFVIPLKKTD